MQSSIEGVGAGRRATEPWHGRQAVTQHAGYGTACKLQQGQDCLQAAALQPPEGR